ncbi:MAG: NAD(P)-dependent oxidoreductase [Armatimonadota bacterium]
MRKFRLKYSGDFLNEQEQVASGYLGDQLYKGADFIDYSFLMDQAPTPGDTTYSDRLYSMQIEPHHLTNADGIVLIRPYVRASTFANGAENLVVIGRSGVGTDKIDLDACTQNDVAVFNAPGTLIHSTASAAMTFVLALAKKLPGQEKMARTGNWENQPSVTGDDLCDLTLGVVGLGRIAAELLRLLKPFGMNVISYSPYSKPEEAEALGVTLVPDLDTLLRESDIVTLHCWLDDQTRGMMGEREFRLMKPTAYFINTGRGELMQQKALTKALQENWIAGAALDVFEHEPLPADDPLIGLDNVILTPHWLPTTNKIVRDVMDTMARGILNTAQGIIPENVVNAAVLERPGFQAKLARFAENRMG